MPSKPSAACARRHEFYSDDFVLGQLVAEAGYKVMLSQYKVGHVLAEALAAAHLWRSTALDEEHAFLAAVGTCRLGLTYAVPFGLLALLLALGSHRHWLELGE